MKEEFTKKIPLSTIESMISYRDGNVDVHDVDIESMEKTGNYVVSPYSNLAQFTSNAYTIIYRIDDNKLEYPTSWYDEWCHIKYEELKKKVCDVLGLPMYVNLDLDWMLSKYHAIKKQRKDSFFKTMF